MGAHRLHLSVSISGEKPIHWRQMNKGDKVLVIGSFNLRREANPLATEALHSISRLTFLFQSQARSQSTGDAVWTINGVPVYWFQSQARSQSTGDLDALPLLGPLADSFNLRREANPL